MNREITPQTYDSHIVQQGERFQIENYYEPREISSKRRIKVVLDAVAPRENDIILDIGCGVGTFAFHCANFGARAYGIDYSFESVKMAGALVHKFGVASRIKFILGNAMRLPFRDASFDKIIAADFIEHITHGDKDALLKEMQRLLKPGGAVVIFTPNGIRERIGDWYWRMRHAFFGETVPSTDLHFGLTTRSAFESLLKKNNFSSILRYVDITRPYLARLPLVRDFLALELLWILKKR